MRIYIEGKVGKWILDNNLTDYNKWSKIFHLDLVRPISLDIMEINRLPADQKKIEMEKFHQFRDTQSASYVCLFILGELYHYTKNQDFLKVIQKATESEDPLMVITANDFILSRAQGEKLDSESTNDLLPWVARAKKEEYYKNRKQ